MRMKHASTDDFRPYNREQPSKSPRTGARDEIMVLVSLNILPLVVIVFWFQKKIRMANKTVNKNSLTSMSWVEFTENKALRVPLNSRAMLGQTSKDWQIPSARTKSLNDFLNLLHKTFMIENHFTAHCKIFFALISFQFDVINKQWLQIISE